jgi:hypothetical protein
MVFGPLVICSEWHARRFVCGVRDVTEIKLIRTAIKSRYVK